MSERDKENLGVSATAREIAQQPRTWRGTRKIFEQHAQHLRAFLEAAGVTSPLEQRPTVVLTGAGTSDYIGKHSPCCYAQSGAARRKRLQAPIY